MARRFRFYGKKRGDRRTGSKRLGSYGEALFFTVLLLIGAGGLYLLLAQWILPEWQANRQFVEHLAAVIDKQIGQTDDEGSTLYRPEIRIRYELDGESREAVTYDVNHLYSRGREETQKILDQYEIGKTYACWYDPDDPDKVVLVRGYNWWMWLLLIVPASFVIIGGGGAIFALLQSGTSAERRAALAQKAAHLDLFDDASERGIDFPTVPSKAHVTDSPGTRLAYRLPVDAMPGWTLAGMISVCLLWNGLVVWLAVVNLRGHLRGDADWPMTILLVPLFCAGVAIIYFTGRQLFLVKGMGTTRVEISGHPLFPGQRYTISLLQTGQLKINSLRVALVCEEEATYRQGTDTRIEVRRIYDGRVYECQAPPLDPSVPFEDSCEIEVPAAAMHSFQSEHNEVKWKLVVTGDVAPGRHYERRFPIVVYPPPPEANGHA